jgi:hypothetical protein
MRHSNFRPDTFRRGLHNLAWDLTDTEWTLVRISPSAGLGVGTSSARSTSGPPNLLRTIAFMLADGRATPRIVVAALVFISARQGLEEAGFFQLIVERWVEKLFGFVTLRSGVSFGH